MAKKVLTANIKATELLAPEPEPVQIKDSVGRVVQMVWDDPEKTETVNIAYQGNTYIMSRYTKEEVLKSE